MIELGKITIKDAGSVIDSRNKVSRLAKDLSFNAFAANRLATIVSEVARSMVQTKQSSHVTAGIEKQKSEWEVSFGFLTTALPPFELEPYFDEVVVSRGDCSIRAFKYAPSGLEISDDLIARTKETVNALSKEELMKELQNTVKQLDFSKKMIHLEKMSAVGLLTAGIAHELNNPMMGILNYVQYCMEHTPREDKRYPVMKDAEREILRCNSLVSDLVSYSRMEDTEEKGYQLENCSILLEQTLSLLSYRLTESNIQVRQHLAPGLPPVLMNPNQIKQVFLNILSNAADALKPCKTKWIDIRALRDGRFLKIVISDSGPGILPEILHKIFEPFFTMKPTGKGTGLGLSISQNIIKMHGGNLECRSSPGKGASFEISLPLSAKGKSHEKKNTGH